MYKRLLACLPVLLLITRSHAQIGFGTTSPNSMLDVRGAVAFLPQVFTADMTANSTHHTLVFTGATAATLTLPDASTCTGRVYWIKNASTASSTPLLTILPAAAQTIGGMAAALLGDPNESMRIVSNGAGWEIYSKNTAIHPSAITGTPWVQDGNTLSSLQNLGTLTNFDMTFSTNGAERMRITTNGYVGIGATSPAGRLHMVNDNDETGNDYIFADYGATVTAGFFIRKYRGTVASPANLQSGDLMGQLRFSGRYNGTLNRTAGSGIDAYYLGNGTTDSSDMRFFTSNTEQMRIHHGGQVSIGTSTLHSTHRERLLVDAGTTTSYNLISGKGSIDNYLQLNIRNLSNGGKASSDIVATADNGDEEVNYIDLGANSNAYSNEDLPILAQNNQTYLFSTGADLVIGNGSPAYNLIFFTNGYGLDRERIRITSAGNVGIGTTTPDDKLSVAGIMAPTINNTYTLGSPTHRWSAVYATNGTIQTSDARLKSNIHSFVFDTDRFMQIEPVRYRWKKYPDGNPMTGLIAQEIQSLLPEAVTDGAVLGMNYETLVPVLISVFQQQQQKLAKLQQELQLLESSLQ
jgi:hypothetical protein